MSTFKIAIVNSSSFGKIFTNHLDELKEIGKVDFFEFPSNISGEALAVELSDYNVIIASVTPHFDAEFFKRMPNLLLISRHGIGFNSIDLEAAKKNGTIVSIVPALVERDAVAEINITNLLNVMRHSGTSQERVREDRWEDRANFVGNTLYEKTVGIIGVGNIGSGVAQTVRNGFRCEVIGYDPYKNDLVLGTYGVKKVELDYLLSHSDVIILCASLNEDNYHMIAEEQFKKMRDGVYIANSARGALIDEKALYTNLIKGKVKGYAADVLEHEPGRKDHPLLSLDNVVITPHIGAYSMECLELMGDKCVDDVIRLSKKKLPERSVQAESNYLVS